MSATFELPETLPLDNKLSIGIMTFLRRTEPTTEPWMPTIADMREIVELVDGCGYDSMWAGDHISFPLSIMDPFIQIAQAAVISPRLKFGTSVFLLPMRHPTPIAKQVATLDHLTEGRFIFGIGVGGEFPKEYEAVGVPRNERGARMTESMEVLRALWTGEPASYKGKYFQFEDVPMRPPSRTAGGPPMWCGGRSDAALKRTGRLADGWVSYVVTPDMYADSLRTIADAAQGRDFSGGFGTSHLLFTRVGDTYETAFDAANKSLSTRYAMDFTKATQRYAAVGNPEQVAERIRDFHAAGVRHIILDIVGPYEDRDEQIQRFADEVLPHLADLR